MVSIILPVHNSEKVIRRAIDSVLKQTYHDWELIVVYDYGIDRTIDMVNIYCNLDARIHCIPNEKSKCPAGARNTAIKYAKGDYIAFIDSKDEWIDVHLEECMDALKVTKYALCNTLWIEDKFGQLNYIGHRFPFDYFFDKMREDLNIIKQDKLWVFDKRLFDYIIYTSFDCYKISTIVVEKEILIRLNGFNEKFLQCEDIELIYRLLHHTLLVTVNNYHYIDYFDADNMYTVENNLLSINHMKQDKSKFNKLNTYLYYRIVLLEVVLSLIDTSDNIQDKKKAKQHLSDVIYNRCMSYSYINRKYCRKKRLFGFFRAIKYIPHAYKEELRLPLPGYRAKHLIIS